MAVSFAIVRVKKAEFGGYIMARIVALGIVAVFLSACTDAGLTPKEGYVDVEGGKVWYQTFPPSTST